MSLHRALEEYIDRDTHKTKTDIMEEALRTWLHSQFKEQLGKGLIEVIDELKAREKVVHAQEESQPQEKTE
jgi:hypothetical protein